MADLSTGKEQDLREVARNLTNIQGSWQFQVFNNVDDIAFYLKGKLREDDHKAVTLMLETLVKQPIRRQLGRVKSAIEHLGSVSN